MIITKDIFPFENVLCQLSHLLCSFNYQGFFPFFKGEVWIVYFISDKFLNIPYLICF